MYFFKYSNFFWIKNVEFSYVTIVYTFFKGFNQVIAGEKNLISTIIIVLKIHEEILEKDFGE